VTTLALCSAKGSPGVTTLTCALGAVWPFERRVVVIEADPSGGDLAARFGLSVKRGMTSLVLALRQLDHRQPEEEFDQHTLRLPGGLEVVVGPVGAEAAAALDHQLGLLRQSLLPPGVDALVDCGRFSSNGSGQRRMLKEADAIFVLSAADAASLAHLRSLLDRLKGLDTPAPVSLLLAGSGEVPAHEVSALFGIGDVERVPRDLKTAYALGGGTGKSKVVAKSPLVACAKRLVNRALPAPEEPSRTNIPDSRHERTFSGIGIG
jgi:Flp pilus assembly CpaE family ATPase